MQRLGWMVALVVIAVACGTAGDMVGEMLDSGVPDAGAEVPGDGSSMQYVGNSAEAFRGSQYERNELGQPIYENSQAIDTGLFPLYAACQETFGPGHRTCTKAEIEFTTKIPNVEGRAWYGIGSNCGLGSGGGLRGAVTASGAFLTLDCSNGPDPQSDTELPIACCGPR